MALHAPVPQHGFVTVQHVHRMMTPPGPFIPLFSSTIIDNVVCIRHASPTCRRLHLCVENLDWMEAAWHFHERRIEEVSLELLGFQGGRHDHQLQIFAIFQHLQECRDGVSWHVCPMLWHSQPRHERHNAQRYSARPPTVMAQLHLRAREGRCLIWHRSYQSGGSSGRWWVLLTVHAQAL